MTARSGQPVWAWFRAPPPITPALDTNRWERGIRVSAPTGWSQSCWNAPRLGIARSACARFGGRWDARQRPAPSSLRSSVTASERAEERGRQPGVRGDGAAPVLTPVKAAVRLDTRASRSSILAAARWTVRRMRDSSSTPTRKVRKAAGSDVADPLFSGTVCSQADPRMRHNDDTGYQNRSAAAANSIGRDQQSLQSSLREVGLAKDLGRGKPP